MRPVTEAEYKTMNNTSDSVEQAIWSSVTSTQSSILNASSPTVSEPSCVRWVSPQHVIFQLANVCFFISYLAPSGKFGILFMHVLLILAFVLFSTWAWNVICAPNVFSWNFGFILLNIGQTLYTLYTMREVKFPAELEGIYQSMFHPLKVSRLLFKKLVSPEYAQIMSLHAGEAYAMQNLTKTDRLGLLITGKVNVISHHHFLHFINPNEFLDSPEFESYRIGAEDKFKVSIIAASPCRYIFWTRQSLEYLLIKESYLSNVLSLLLSRDITTKLYSMNEKIVTEKGSHLDIRLPSLTGSIVSQTTTTTTQDDYGGGRSGSFQTPLRTPNNLKTYVQYNSLSNDIYQDCDTEDSVFDSKEKFPESTPVANKPAHP